MRRIDETLIYLKLNFQFQKVRLWAPFASNVSLRDGFSIPKGAIMRLNKKKGGSNDKSLFNSKRCDYESLSVSCSSIICQFSIPKGAIMRTNAITNNLTTVDFQFQKVRLWVASAISLSSSSNFFNSKRCDYEHVQKVLSAIWNFFNSKRCDYEKARENDTSNRLWFSIPKGAIMRQLPITTEICHRVFNSKRCDYEKIRTTYKNLQENFSIPKGAIMS